MTRSVVTRTAFAAGVLSLCLSASMARADYAVVRFESGFCQVWADSASDPWGSGWTKLAIGLPDFESALALMRSAQANGDCGY